MKGLSAGQGPMNLRDFVRWTVSRTNPYWPFSSLNKIPYSLAIKSFIRMAEKFPEIKSVYLRHGLLRKDWVPAISDVDLTLIMERGMEPEQEFRFLGSFWTEFKRFKKVFPMLGEIDILREKECDSWVSVTIRGYEAKEWVLLSGKKTLPETRAWDPETLKLDSMDHAMTCYLAVLLPRLFNDGPRSPVFDDEIKRLQSKIMRYIYYGENIENQNGYLPGFDCVPALIKSFDDRLQALGPGIEKSSEKECGWERVVSSVVLSHNRDVLILKDGVEVGPGFDWIKAGNIPSGRNASPAIVSKKMFEYLIRFFDPFLYVHLGEYGKLTYGNHPVQDLAAPEISSFIRCVLKQTPNVLAFSQTAELVCPNLYPAHSERTMDSMLEHALFIKLFAEKGFIKQGYRAMLTASQEQYPEYFQQLEQLKQRGSNLERFKFWRSLAQEVYSLKPENVNHIWKH